MRQFKRFLSLMLVMVLLLGMIPVSSITVAASSDDEQTYYTVTFDYCDETRSPKKVKVVAGECVPKPGTPGKGGAIFEAWYTLPFGGEKFDFNSPINEDITIYAHWYLMPGWGMFIGGLIDGNKQNISGGSKTYTVTFDANGSDVENLPAVQTVRSGEYAVEPADPTKLIHDFGGWYTDSSCTNPFDFSTPITSNISLYAKWDITIYSKPLDESHVKTGTLEYEGEKYEGQYIDNELIIFVKDGINRKYVEQLVAPLGGTVVGQIPTIGQYQIEFNSSKDIDELESITNYLVLTDNVVDVQLNHIIYYKLDEYIPTDSFGEEDFERWGKHSYNTWHFRAAKIPEAWTLLENTTNNSILKVGIIDGSFDEEHPDVSFDSVVYYDQNYTGANYSQGANHGMHVAGIIGANHDGVGIAGILPNVRLYAAGCLDNELTHTNLLGKKDYLCSYAVWSGYICAMIEMDIKIINMSLGGYTPIIQSRVTEILTDSLLKYLDSAKQFILVTSSGNEGTETHDVNKANIIAAIDDIRLRNRIIVVGNARTKSKATILDDGYIRNEHSSYNGNRVDIMAPGTYIYSTIAHNEQGVYSKTQGYDYKEGTSMASPFVAGVAGLIWQVNPNLSPERVKEILVSTANIDVADSDANMVNAEAAVIKALGYDPRTKDITFKFVDTATNSAIKAQLVSWHGIEYSPKYAYHPELDLNDLKLTYWELNGDENSTISTVPYTVPYGEFRFEFEAPGYQKTTVAFSVDDDTDVVTINMTPEGTVIPPEEGTHTLRIKFFDSETKEIITDDVYACLYTGPEETNYAVEQMEDAVIANEYYYYNLPSSEYYFLNIRAPEWYVDTNYGYIVITEETGDVQINVPLTRQKLIVDDVLVTSDNATDVLGNGTVKYDVTNNLLTLTNATIEANQPIYSNKDLNIKVPQGTLTTLTVNSDTYYNAIDVVSVTFWGGIVNSTVLSSSDIGGSLHIKGSGYESVSFSILASKGISAYGINFVLQNSTHGIRSGCGNMYLNNCNIADGNLNPIKCGILNVMDTTSYDFDPHGWNAGNGSISIYGCNINHFSDNGSIIYAAGDISIRASDVVLGGEWNCLIWSRGGTLTIGEDNLIVITTDKSDVSTDHLLICGAEGIAIHESINFMDITGKTPVECEIYFNSSINGYSIRCDEITYPTYIYLK